jgi:hypothetical protein
MKNKGPKGQYVQKGPAQRAITLWESYQIINTGPKDHCVQKGPARRDITLRESYQLSLRKSY